MTAAVWRLLLALLVLLVALRESTTSEVVHVTSLTAQYLEDPLGVDVPNPRVSWRVMSHASRGVYQTSYHIEVSDTPYFCEIIHENTRESSKSHLVPLLLSDNSSKVSLLQSDGRYYWRVTVRLNDGSTATSQVASFGMGLLQSSDWKGQWITGGNEKTLLRSEFMAPQVNSHATLFISGVGYHEVYLNGVKVGNHRLDNGWTDYSKRVWYSTHDITNDLLLGTNVIGVMLGNGWWSCGHGPNMPACSKSPPQLLLQLHVDGQVVFVSNDADDQATTAKNGNSIWRAAAGPIKYNSLYNGETYDGRIAAILEGWSSSNFEASNWTPVSLAHSAVNNATLTSQLFESIREISTRSPISINAIASSSVTTTTNASNSTLIQVVDFGQNQAAVVRLKHVKCPRGATITLRHAEILTHPPYGPTDGSIYVGNLRSARATDTYICRGDPNGETYIPTFTQHGFRYVEVSGLSYPLKEDDLEAVELHSDVKQTSSLLFSYPLLNEIHQMVIWGQKSNLMSVPTDCPQRDERRGWMGDVALTAEEAAYNFGMGAFYSRWLLQIVDTQASDGSVPNYVPALHSHDGAPNWQSAFPVVVWTLYTYYGDSDVVVRFHDALVRYYDYLEAQYNKTGVKQFRQGFGDWCPPPPHPKSNGHLLGAFALIHDLQLGAELFGASLHTDAAREEKRCSSLVSKLSAEYHEAFFNTTTGVYMAGLQTEQALSLYLGLTPASVRSNVVTQLLQDIQITQSNHTTSGIVGIKFLMGVLSGLGYSNVALELALQRTYPSW